MKQKMLNVLFAVIFMVMTMAIGGAQAAEKTISLVSGWNLINTPLEPTSTAITDVLSGINYATAWSWDAANSKWSVYLSGEGTPGDYAKGKGFGVLSTISAGEGVWLNANAAADLTITGAAPAATDHAIVKGWNLIGALKDEIKTVSSVLSMMTTAGVNAQTLWAWDAAGQKWDVAIPSYTSTELATYIAAKGFTGMETIASTAGFWINASDGGSVTETPPTVGKAYKTTGENAYVPLVNVPVYVNGVFIGKTDSNGNFELPSDIKAADVITIGSGESFTVSASQIVDGALYMFAQDQDTNKVKLFVIDSIDKPTPKKITSSDGKASITITSMKLLKDITVAVTPYKTAISAPNVALVKALDPNYVVVAGADVIYVDSNGGNISLTEAGFQGVVYPEASNFLGEMNGAALYKYLGEDDPTKAVGSLALLQYVDGVWTKVGGAELAEETTQGKPETVDDLPLEEGPKSYYLKVASGVQPDTSLYPFLFVFKMEYLIGSIDVTLTNGGIMYKTADGETLITEGTEGKGVVIEESFGDSVVGAMVTADSADSFGATAANGTTTIEYVLPPDNPNIALIIKKDGYFDASVIVNVVDDEAKTVAMLERPDTAAVGGNIYDTVTDLGIAEAKVTLKNPIVLDKIADDGETIQVGLDGEATYTWEIKKQGSETWVIVAEGLGSEGKNQITKTEIKTKLITNFESLSEDDKSAIGANPIGTYDVKITVSHPFGEGEAYVESAEGYLDISFNIDDYMTSSIAMAKPGKVSVFGGKDMGFYYATAPVTGDITWKWTVTINSWDDANGNGLVDDEETIEELFVSVPTDIPFFSFVDALNLVQNNYLALLGKPEGGFNDPEAADMSYLEYGFSVNIAFTANYDFNGTPTEDKSFAEFDIIADDPLVTLVVGKLMITPNTTMAFEAVQETDSEGDYLFTFLDPQLSGLLGLYAAAETYKQNSIFLAEETYPLLKGWITSVDLGLDPVNPPAELDEVPDWVETFEGATEAAQIMSAVKGDWAVEGNDLADIQWWALKNPETYGPAAQTGIDYPVLDANNDGVADNDANLLPAFGGDTVAWFGSKTTYTFSDTDGNSSSGSKNGKLTSPEIDLTEFSFATLDVASWFEVESVDVAKWQYDQMKVMIAVVADSYPVTIGDYTFADATDYKIVAFMNPDNEAAIQSAAINYSSGGNDVVPVWVKVQKNLNLFAGHKIKLQFYFNSQDSLFNGFRGWAVDDVSILNEDSGLPFILETSNYWWSAPVRQAE